MNDQNPDTNNPETPAPAPGFYDDRGGQEARTQPPPPPPPPPPEYGKNRRLPYKSPVAAGIFSGLFPGMGHIYLGYVQAGFIRAAIVAAVITALASGAISGAEPLFGIFLGFFYFYNIIDAARTASLINRTLDGLEQAELPEDYKMPGSGGSLAGGVVLIIIGFLIFMDTKFDMSMEWLDEWWPLGLVALGGWLIYRARQERK